jgi:hypothetical protein
MTEDEFWNGLEFRICRELSGMDDKVLRHMWCDGIRGDIVLREPGPAYMYGTIWIAHHRPLRATHNIHNRRPPSLGHEH